MKSNDSATAGYRAAIEGRFDDAYKHLVGVEGDNPAAQYHLSIVRWALEKYGEIPLEPPRSLCKRDRQFMLDLGEEASRRAGANSTRRKANADNSFARAFRLFEKGRFADSAVGFGRVLDAEPTNYRAWNNRADQFMRLQLLDHALICASIAVVGNPDDGISFCTLGEILVKLEMYREALACFEASAALSSDPKELSYLKREVSALTGLAEL